MPVLSAKKIQNATMEGYEKELGLDLKIVFQMLSEEILSEVRKAEKDELTIEAMERNMINLI